ncbi:unnamed protein product [Moneuplotes crassus]|uniref:Uncharacterized protein n=1 Tax=Euplotes crassus TaxID=5936 RepID=A0AAD1XSK8_EUPCR|nr:unnamed protein product [Moneuplotes crassus]
MSRANKKVSTLKGRKKGDKSITGSGVKNPTVVRHQVPPRQNHLSQHNVNRLHAPSYSMASMSSSTLRRGIGSGASLPHQRGYEGHVFTRPDECQAAQNNFVINQYHAREMLQTLTEEVNGLNRDREELRRTTENAQKAYKKTIDYLSPSIKGQEGHCITTEGAMREDPPEKVFLEAISLSKDLVQQTCEIMKTPTKIDFNEDNEHFRDTDKVLHMSPPLSRYNPTTMQQTFELNLDGITLKDLEIMKKQNEARLKAIEDQYFTKDVELTCNIAKLEELTKDEQYIIKSKDNIVNIPLNSLAEINGDMINLDDEEEENEQTKSFSKRLIYELRFEKYLKRKIKDEIVRKEKFKKDQYISPEELEKIQKKLKLENMVKKKLGGKILTPEEEEIQRIQDQARIDCDDEYLIIIKQIFNDCLEDSENLHPNEPDEDNYERKPLDSVDKDIFVSRVLSEEKVKPFLHVLARDPQGASSIDSESFFQVLTRMQNYCQQKYITWDKILPYFTRKGGPISEIDIKKLIPKSDKVKEIDEDERAARNKKINHQVRQKMSQMPKFPKKDGEGKYKITVPKAPQSEKRDQRKGLSIRERKLQEMIKYDDIEDEYELSQKFRAKPIPKSTLEPRFKKIMEANEKRRNDVKQRSIAMTKQNEKPFSFYERDMKKLFQPPVYDPEYDVMNYEPFKANPVPGHAKIQMFQYKTNKENKERDARIKEMAELSLSQSRLPPRMAVYENQRLTEKTQKRSKSLDNPEFTFKPVRSRPVPDFERIHYEFQKELEAKRRSKSVTKGEPFRFSEAKPNKVLRQYMDAQNRPEEKLMTFKMRKTQAEIDSLKPPTKTAQSTLKFDSQVAMRRAELEAKLQKELVQARDDIDREYKTTRMKDRVMKSPAIHNNTQCLREMRERSQRQAKENMEFLEKVYDRKRAEIDVNVANRPLLVEMQSKDFYNQYVQMQEVEKYANLLEEAKFDPNEHLTEHQKILLKKAEAFEQLNAEHAYFPTVNQAFLCQPLQESMQVQQFDQEFAQDDMEDEMENEGYTQQLNEVPEMEEHDEGGDSEIDQMPPQYDEDYEEQYDNPPQPEMMA